MRFQPNVSMFFFGEIDFLLFINYHYLFMIALNKIVNGGQSKTKTNGKVFFF